MTRDVKNVIIFKKNDLTKYFFIINIFSFYINITVFVTFKPEINVKCTRINTYYVRVNIKLKDNYNATDRICKRRDYCIII